MSQFPYHNNGTPNHPIFHSPAESYLYSDPETVATSFFDSDGQRCTTSPADSDLGTSSFSPTAPYESQLNGLGQVFDDDALVTGPSTIDGPLFGAPVAMDFTADDALYLSSLAATDPAQTAAFGDYTEDYVNPTLIQGDFPPMYQAHYGSGVPNVVYDDNNTADDFYTSTRVKLQEELDAPSQPGAASAPASPAFTDDKVLDGRRGAGASSSKPAGRLPRREGHYRCDHEDCGRTFDTRSDLNHHAQYHRPADLLCGVDGCNSRFPVNSQLRRHRETVHVDNSSRKYHCLECNVHTSRNDVYQRHIKTRKHLSRCATLPVEIHQ